MLVDDVSRGDCGGQNQRARSCGEGRHACTSHNRYHTCCVVALHMELVELSFFSQFLYVMWRLPYLCCTAVCVVLVGVLL